jgi:hypothetical protein
MTEENIDTSEHTEGYYTQESPEGFGKRQPKAGVTGTYEIVFRNGAKTTLTNVYFYHYYGGNPRKYRPIFRAYGGGTPYIVSWSSTYGTVGLEPDDVVAIFRISED